MVLQITGQETKADCYSLHIEYFHFILFLLMNRLSGIVYLITCKLFLRMLWVCCFSVLISKKFPQIRLYSMLIYLFLEVIFGLDCHRGNCWQHGRKNSLHFVLQHFVKTDKTEQALHHCLSALWGKCLFDSSSPHLWCRTLICQREITIHELPYFYCRDTCRSHFSRLNLEQASAEIFSL